MSLDRRGQVRKKTKGAEAGSLAGPADTRIRMQVDQCVDCPLWAQSQSLAGHSRVRSSSISGRRQQRAAGAVLHQRECQQLGCCGPHAYVSSAEKAEVATPFLQRASWCDGGSRKLAKADMQVPTLRTTSCRRSTKAPVQRLKTGNHVVDMSAQHHLKYCAPLPRFPQSRLSADAM